MLINHSYSEYNSCARLHNGFIRDPDHPLKPLRSTLTNADVPGFPATITVLTAMTGAQIDPILAAFGLATDGMVSERRQRLRFYIGLPKL